LGIAIFAKKGKMFLVVIININQHLVRKNLINLLYFLNKINYFSGKK